MRLRHPFACLLLACALAPAARAVAVRVGTSNSSTDATFFIADKKGYFRAEGLEVSFVAFDTAAKMVAPLGAGQTEMIGSKSGLGYLIWNAWEILPVEIMYVGLFVIALIGIVLHLLLNEVARLAIPWRAGR